MIFALQLLTSPVAPEWTIKDDSNGSIACDHFVCLGAVLMKRKNGRSQKHFDDPPVSLALCFMPTIVAGVSLVLVAGSVSPPASSGTSSLCAVEPLACI